MLDRYLTGHEKTMAGIRQRNGKWQARVTVAGKEVSRSFLTKTDATRWAREQRIEMERAISMGLAGHVTLADVIDRFAEEVLPLKRAGQKDRYLIRRFRAMPWAELPIIKVQPEHIVQMRDLRLREVSTGSVRRELDLLSSIFTHAIKEWRLCRENPVLSIRKPSPGRARQRRLLQGELERIIAASQAPDFEPIVLLAFETAMRRGELLELMWENIDFRRRIAYLPLTKNGEPRQVPLSKKALAVLKGLSPKIEGKVFTKNATTLSGAFQRAVLRARQVYVEECVKSGRRPDPKYLTDLRFHDIRHAATTRLVEHGLSIIEVSAITGHKTLSMLKRYSHPDPVRLAKRIENIGVDSIDSGVV